MQTHARRHDARGHRLDAVSRPTRVTEHAARLLSWMGSKFDNSQVDRQAP